MELQTALVICGAGVAVVAVLLLAGLFSTSGTSYEEAVAQQRRAATELLALADSMNKTKKSKKANKKQAKKEKKESGHVNVNNASEAESEAPADSGADEESPQPQQRAHVEFSAPVIVDIPCDSPLNIKIRKRGKDARVKPILVNKEDPSCVSDPSSPPTPTGVALTNHFEKIHPKDEFELLHASLAEKVEKKDEVVEKKEVKANKSAKSNKATPKATTPEPVKETAQRDVLTAAESPRDQRKAKKMDKKLANEEPTAPVREECVPPLNTPQPSELTTEKLLKQALATATAAAPGPATPSVAAPPQATKPKRNKKAEQNVLSLMAAGDGGGVNVSELVRLVSEAALSRNEIQLLTDTLLNKQHDPLPQHSEWTEGPNDPMQKLKKQLADKEKALTDELEASRALHAKLKELRGSLNSERTRASAVARSLDEARTELLTAQALLQRQRDEARGIDQDRLMLQSKLGAEADTRVQMEVHIQRLSESEASLMQQLNALQAELSARAVEVGQARCELVAARDATIIAQQQVADLAQQLQEANRVYSDLDAQRQNALHGEQMAQQELRQAQDRIAALSELHGEVQRASSRAQIAETKVDKIQEEAEKQRQQLSNEIASLREQLSSRDTEIAELKQLKVASTSAQNGLPPVNASAEHKSAELAKVESVIETLRAELATARRDGGEQRDQLARLQTQLDHYRDKNNELRTKNWKVMEALQSAEKTIQARTASAIPVQGVNEAVRAAVEAQYREVAAALRAACPRAAVDAAPSRAWIDTFAANLRKELDRAAPVMEQKVAPQHTEVDSERVAELRAQVDHLQALVDKYKTIIGDTEGVLSRLQHNVASEEARWARQLAEKQRELDDLRARTITQMQNKIDSLQSELQKTLASKHNHSFADSERLTEENSRLMADLKDIHKLDSSNGPLQVDLDEK